jgi:hypothetical protein
MRTSPAPAPNAEKVQLMVRIRPTLREEDPERTITLEQVPF